MDKLSVLARCDPVAIYEDIKRMIRSEEFWEKLRERKLDELSARVRELEVYEHQLSPEQMIVHDRQL